MRSQTADKIIERIRKKDTPYNIEVLDIVLRIDKDVYPTGEESIFLAENLQNPDYGIKENEKVLDYGTGTGFLAIIAAKLGGKIIATEFNSFAINCAKHNISQNNVEDKIEVRLGESFECIRPEEKFDVVLANLPYEEAEPKDILEYSVYDPNFQMRKDLFNKIKKHLTKGGRMFFTYSESVQKTAPIERSSKEFNYKIIGKKTIGNEVYLLYLITPK